MRLEPKSIIASALNVEGGGELVVGVSVGAAGLATTITTITTTYTPPFNYVLPLKSDHFRKTQTYGTFFSPSNLAGQRV